MSKKKIIKNISPLKSSPGISKIHPVASRSHMTNVTMHSFPTQNQQKHEAYEAQERTMNERLQQVRTVFL